MERRDTEGAPSSFRTTLFDEVGIYDLQGLLMNAEWQATAGVEALDYTPDESIDIIDDLGRSALSTKVALTDALDVPMYVVTSRNADRLGDILFDIYEVSYSGSVSVNTTRSSITPANFVEFWADLKGTTSTKPLPDADVRIQDSNVDNALREGGLEWGGNVDAILTDSNQNVRGIIECRKTNKSRLNRYDPDDYFHYRGGDYNTWKPLYNISNQLGVPLILLTFEDGADQCGCAYIESMNRNDGLSYQSGITPDNNLLTHQEAVRELTGLS